MLFAALQRFYKSIAPSVAVVLLLLPVLFFAAPSVHATTIDLQEACGEHCHETQSPNIDMGCVDHCISAYQDVVAVPSVGSPVSVVLDVPQSPSLNGKIDTFLSRTISSHQLQRSSPCLLSVQKRE